MAGKPGWQRQVERMEAAARDYATAAEFIAAVEGGALIRKGEAVRSRQFPQVGGFVVGEGEMFVNPTYPVWKVRKLGGGKDALLKGDAVHMHGIHDLAGFWAFATGNLEAVQ
jgi:hypothetical protein